MIQTGLDNAALLLKRAAARLPHKPAILQDEGETTYEELESRALSIGEGLQKLGVRPADRVGVLVPRSVDAVVAFFGVLSAGAAVVIINETLRPRQIEHVLADSGARILLTTGTVLGRLPRAIDAEARLVEIKDFDAAGLTAPTRRISTDLAILIYTSGSTGLPKGIALSHGNVWAGMHAVTSYLSINEQDRIASLLPFSFDYGLNQLLCSVGTAATLCIETAPVPQRIVETLRLHETTVLPAVPPLWLQLLGVETFAEPLPSLRLMTNTGGRLPTAAVKELREYQPRADLVLMYGLTEAFRSTYLAPDKVDRKPNSIGNAIPGAEITVVDKELLPCEPNEVGELVHRGPTVALGYWNDSEATERIFRPNPFRPTGAPDSERVVFSGDLVYRDEEGDLFFVGRRDSMIKTLGYRVSPDEVVDVLHASGEVAEAVVTSEPDDVRGEQIVAHIVLRQEGCLENLEQFCSRELPRYMQPSRFDVRSSLPRTGSGKFDARRATGAHDGGG